MPRVCTVCTHPERAAIDEALAARRDSFRGIALTYRVSPDAVERHHRRHLPTLPAPAASSTPPTGEVPLPDATALATQKPAQDRRARFVQEYLVDLNATQAAIRAGYSPRTAGSQAHDLLKIPEIQAAIQVGMDERARRVGMTADDVLRELKVIGMSDVGDYQVGDPAAPVKVRDGAAPEARRAVSSVKRRVRRIQRNDGPPEEIEDVELRLWNKPEALRLAGQHLKLFGEPGEGGGAVEKVFFLPVVAVNVEDWQRQVAERKTLPPG